MNSLNPLCKTMRLNELGTLILDIAEKIVWKWGLDVVVHMRSTKVHLNFGVQEDNMTTDSHQRILSGVPIKSNSIQLSIGAGCRKKRK
ncbi:hypothetical protein ACHAWU_002097 [Discostella pseudostelligera]|uniref:Uncharacterized protein n=1 Tax=Discostella pseudostelligera TaxID=259834 RepID=A0ABD3M982_9STRA